jgi:hypothetical protein
VIRHVPARETVLRGCPTRARKKARVPKDTSNH